MSVPPALAGDIRSLNDPAAGRLSWYQGRVVGAAAEGTPLVLLHSINAAASAYEMKPLYEHFAASRPVYAPDLPGFGLSERSARAYTPRLMTDAVHALLAAIAREHGPGPVDAIALSLSCEFLARAATEQPRAFRSLAFISPTGFNCLPLRHGPPGGTLGSPRLAAWLANAALGRTLFRLLTRPAVIRYFLRRTWGSHDIDAGVAAYATETARAEGAERAPLHFLSGVLFSADSGRLYEALTQPVWVVHGVRGDFVDYRGLGQLAARRNWTVEELPAGALPQFEMGAQLNERYRRWLDRPVATAATEE